MTKQITPFVVINTQINQKKIKKIDLLQKIELCLLCVLSRDKEAQIISSHLC